MKSFKFLLINALTLIIGLGLMSGSLSQRNAQAARFELIPPISVSGLGNHRGQYLTLLYVIASRPLIGIENSQITVVQVKESRTVYIAADEMSMPAVKIGKEGFRPSYNMVLAVLSNTADFSWINADGNLPPGSTATSSHRFENLKIISKSDIEARASHAAHSPSHPKLHFDFNSLN